MTAETKQCPYCAEEILAVVIAAGLATTLGVLAIACSGSQSASDNAIDPVAVGTVARALTGTLGVVASDLHTKPNQVGDGTFVYVPETRFSGVERYLLWMVLDGKAYPINGESKNVTPSLSWPRDAPDDVWSKTRLSPSSATHAIEIVFGHDL